MSKHWERAVLRAWRQRTPTLIRDCKRPAAQLKERFPSLSNTIDRAVARTGRPLNKLRTLPLISRKTAWTVLIDAQSVQPVGFVAMDSF